MTGNIGLLELTPRTYSCDPAWIIKYFNHFQKKSDLIGIFAKYLANSYENCPGPVHRRMSGVIYDIYYTGFPLFTILPLDNLLDKLLIFPFFLFRIEEEILDI